MANLRSIGLLFSLAMVGACAEIQNSAEPALEQIVFGYYFGECAGDCATLFKLEGGKLYADDIEFPFELATDEGGFYSHETEKITFKNNPLPNEYFNVSERLLSVFPEEFLNLDEQAFGSPDAYDQGAIYLAVKHQGKRQVWTIDPDNNFKGPKYVLKYREEISNTLKDLADLSEGMGQAELK